jgi:TonB family protein
MFFAPPKVKSLSQYAEFGSHLHEKHFLITLAVAVIIHMAIIGVYAMVPREEIIQIPVRALNIKLSGAGGGGVEAPINAPVTPAEMKMSINGVPVREENKSITPAETQPEKTVQTEIDKAVAKAAPRHTVYDKSVKAGRHGRGSHRNQGSNESVAGAPRQYVRASEMGAGGTEEIVQRYEQTISLWIANRKMYPEAAKQQGIEGDAIVRVRINRNGHITYNAIERSSGNEMIDEAVTAMVRRSDPVPAVPENYPDAGQLEFLIPVSFRLK